MKTSYIQLWKDGRLRGYLSPAEYDFGPKGTMSGKWHKYVADAEISVSGADWFYVSPDGGWRWRAVTPLVNGSHVRLERIGIEADTLRHAPRPVFHCERKFADVSMESWVSRARWIFRLEQADEKALNEIAAALRAGRTPMLYFENVGLGYLTCNLTGATVELEASDYVRDVSGPRHWR